MAKTTSIEARLAAVEERLDKLEGKPGSDWQPLIELITHPSNPFPRWALINQMQAAIKDPTASQLKYGVHFVNGTGRYYVRPLPYLKAVGVVGE
jgi:hypothetical protein